MKTTDKEALHSATLCAGKTACFTGCEQKCYRINTGKILESSSIAAVLIMQAWAELAYLADIGVSNHAIQWIARPWKRSMTFAGLKHNPGAESSHAVAYVKKAGIR